jgi:hypothetical protein
MDTYFKDGFDGTPHIYDAPSSLLQFLGQLRWMDVVLQHFDSAVLALIDVDEPSWDDVFDWCVVVSQACVGVDPLFDVIAAVVA